eukprot:Ihof_evm15s57 gene=Ihof_evmTU15s57
MRRRLLGSSSDLVNGLLRPKSRNSSISSNLNLTDKNGDSQSYATFLCISIVQARDLVAGDWNGYSDPYFVVTCGSRTYKSKTIKKTLAPIWNERLDFGFDSDEIPPISIKVYDWDRNGKDDFLGELSYTVEDKDYGQYPPFKWFNLQNCKTGEIQLQVAAYKQSVDKADKLKLESTRWLGLTTLTILNMVQLLIAPVLGKVQIPSGMYRTENSQQLRFWVNDTDEKRIIRYSVFDGEILLGRGYMALQEFLSLEGTDTRVSVSIHEEDKRLSDKFANTIKCTGREAVAIDTMTDITSMKDPDNNDQTTNKSPSPERVLVHHCEMESTGRIVGHVDVTVNYMSRSNVERWFFKRLLSEFDTNNDGALDAAEVKVAFDTIDHPLSLLEAESLFKRMDLDGNGVLEESELVQYLCSAEFQSRPFSYSMLAFLTSGQLGLESLISDTYCTVETFKPYEGAQGLSAVVDGEKQVIGLLMCLDRETGLIVEEFIPKYIKLALNLMYDVSFVKGLTSLKAINRVLVSMSQKEGNRMNSPASKKKIVEFIEQHKLNVNEILEPVDSFPHFNAFFYRKLKPSARPIACPDNSSILVSPADCRLMVFETIMDATKIWIKGSAFTIDNLFGEAAADIASKFYGGSLVIARLSPQDYHRFHSPVTGKLSRRTAIGGELYTVNPVAIRQPLNVYTENKRELCEIETDDFGLIVMIHVGATMVGSINITATDGSMIKKGDEHGYFAFGGSTVLLLFQPGTVK